MRERLEDLRLHWQHMWWMVRHMSGVSQDRFGKHYWRTVYEYSPGHFQVRLTRWPGLSYFSDLSGWIALGRQKDDPASWMIFDVQVHDRQRGLGTVLVRAGIALARQKGARELQGFVTTDDAKDHPFLPAWYARLGFMVASNRTFTMPLKNE
jgi:GNAT superfamily N-acetyltransferase